MSLMCAQGSRQSSLALTANSQPSSLPASLSPMLFCNLCVRPSLPTFPYPQHSGMAVFPFQPHSPPCNRHRSISSRNSNICSLSSSLRWLSQRTPFSPHQASNSCIHCSGSLGFLPAPTSAGIHLFSRSPPGFCLPSHRGVLAKFTPLMLQLHPSAST